MVPEAAAHIQAYLDQLRKHREPLAVESGEWDRFVQRYSGLLERLVHSRRSSREDWEDSIQELWLLLLKRLPELRYNPAYGGLDGWISVVVKNRLVDQDRYRSNHSTKHLDAEMARDLSSREPDPVLAFARKHLIDLVRDALAELQDRVSPRDFEAFSLHWVEGLSVREVAQRLGRTEAEIWSSDHRLTVRLRPILERRLALGTSH